MLKKSELPPCPIALTIGLIGSKWKLYVLREFVLNGERHFGELLLAVEGISKKSLTESLRALEGDGLVRRRVEPGRPPRVAYGLSPLGRTLLPLFDAMAVWGETYRREID